MKGVDSSVLLRYILEDDPVWTKPASRFIDEECGPTDRAYVNLVVLVEVVWSLRRQSKDIRSDTISVVRGMLESDSLEIEREDAVSQALARFQANEAGFSDCLIACLNERAGASPTYSIDKFAIKRGIFRGLER